MKAKPHLLALGLVAFAAGAQAEDGLEAFAEVMHYALPAAAAGVAVAEDDPDGFRQFVATWAATQGATAGLKRAVDSRRPDGGDRSFPSAHGSAAFSSAAFLHFRYGWERGLPAALVASAVGYSRVAQDRHHVRDVAASAALAYGAAWLLTDAQGDGVFLLPMAEMEKPSFGVVARLPF